MPLVTTLEPGDDGVVVVVLYIGIAKNRMTGTSFDGFLYGWCYGKVHIGNPHGDDVFVSHFVPFDATGSSALNQFVEVVGHLVSIIQLLGWRTFSSMVTEPMLSATIYPLVGFLMFSICPRI